MWRKAKPPTNRRHELLLELFYNINAGDKGWLEEEDLQSHCDRAKLDVDSDALFAAINKGNNGIVTVNEFCNFFYKNTHWMDDMTFRRSMDKHLVYYRQHQIITRHHRHGGDQVAAHAVHRVLNAQRAAKHLLRDDRDNTAVIVVDTRLGRQLANAERGRGSQQHSEGAEGGWNWSQRTSRAPSMNSTSDLNARNAGPASFRSSRPGSSINSTATPAMPSQTPSTRGRFHASPRGSKSSTEGREGRSRQHSEDKDRASTSSDECSSVHSSRSGSRASSRDASVPNSGRNSPYRSPRNFNPGGTGSRGSSRPSSRGRSPGAFQAPSSRGRPGSSPTVHDADGHGLFAIPGSPLPGSPLPGSPSPAPRQRPATHTLQLTVQSAHADTSRRGSLQLSDSNGTPGPMDGQEDLLPAHLGGKPTKARRRSQSVFAKSPFATPQASRQASRQASSSDLHQGLQQNDNHGSHDKHDKHFTRDDQQEATPSPSPAAAVLFSIVLDAGAAAITANMDDCAIDEGNEGDKDNGASGAGGGDLAGGTHARLAVHQASKAITHLGGVLVLDKVEAMEEKERKTSIRSRKGSTLQTTALSSRENSTASKRSILSQHGSRGRQNSTSQKPRKNSTASKRSSLSQN